MEKGKDDENENLKGLHAGQSRDFFSNRNSRTLRLYAGVFLEKLPHDDFCVCAKIRLTGGVLVIFIEQKMVAIDSLFFIKMLYFSRFDPFIDTYSTTDRKRGYSN